MIDWIATGVLVCTIVGMIVKYAVDKGSLEARVGNLEKQDERLLNKDFLTSSSHKEMSLDCRAEIYRDMDRMEATMKELVGKLVALEERREHKEERTEERLQEIAIAITEIKVLLKRDTGDTQKIGVY